MKVNQLKDMLISTLFSGVFVLSSHTGLAAKIELPTANPTSTENINYSISQAELALAEPVTSTPVELATAYQASAAVANPATYTTVSTPANSISILGATSELQFVDDTIYDAGTAAKAWAVGQLYYGHNYDYVFGRLAYIGIGDIITTTVNGQTINYQVVNKVTLEKPVVATYMNSFVRARYNGNSYSIALMTCAGTIYGNGDASHRTIVFANAL